MKRKLKNLPKKASAKLRSKETEEEDSEKHRRIREQQETRWMKCLVFQMRKA
jgi:hypothetical protein